MYVLDTDTCIYMLNGRADAITARLRTLTPADVTTTAVTAAELRYGARHSGRPEANLVRAETFLTPLLRLPFDDEAAVHFAEIRQDLVARGQPIGVMDLLIAAITRSRDGTLVTNNIREFSRVPGLEVENWLEA